MLGGFRQGKISACYFKKFVHVLQESPLSGINFKQDSDKQTDHRGLLSDFLSADLCGGLTSVFYSMPPALCPLLLNPLSPTTGPCFLPPVYYDGYVRHISGF
jgi:hypothetical protein